MKTALSPAAGMGAFGVLAGLPPELAVRRAVPILAGVSLDPAFLDVHIFPYLDEARRAEDWYVASQYDAGDGSYSMQVFVWPPGSRTRIHDHTTWGAYYCVLGSVIEERYERLDDGTRPDHARLKKLWRLSWSRQEGISTVLPYDKGIHSVGNGNSETAVSVHLYGPKLTDMDGRDYDPSRDYVCDRFDA